ncbi:hypothetical protein HELRODRAFT_82642, partial [Helobdella robusta]|uniref:G-protein coupled receptors family 1 profile domain-containing protein n=1 Tax=Helobdella robusta TaxID=6412 RepID=T1G4U5_HELRO
MDFFNLSLFHFNVSNISAYIQLQGELTFEPLVSFLETYLNPIVIIVGIIGNVLSLSVFSTTHLNRITSSLYLAVLSFGNILYLIAMSFTWLDRILGFSFLVSQCVCPITSFLYRICEFIAAWSVVSFTAERYITVKVPLLKDVLCTRQKALYTVTVTILCSVFFNI